MWTKFIASFHNSEVIVFARVQMFLGIVAAVAFPIAQVLFATDLTPLFSDPRAVVAWMFFSGLAQEFLRRHREDWGGGEHDDTNENVDARNHP